MTDMHRVSDADFAQLSAGHADRDTVRQLRDGQFSKILLLIRAMHDATSNGGSSPLSEGLQLLAQVQATAPDVVRDVLTYPLVGAWATQSMRVLKGKAACDASPEDMLGHLSGIAAAAAVAAGERFEISVPARAGTVVLPGLGRVNGCAGLVVVSSSGTGLKVDGEPAGDWQPVHRMETAEQGLTLSIVLDDVDWYRDCHGMGATDRLEIQAVQRWRELLQDAWSMLVADHREYATGIAEGLRVLVPLRADPTSKGITATSADAFGAMASSPPTDAATLALGLVHEFQHGKLGALMDLVKLHDASDERRYYAPWRDDPRPLGGLLHGAYAFAAVADFWRARRRADDERQGFAEFEFARWRERVSRVLDVLDSSDKLTGAGRRLVGGMRENISGWWDEPVRADVSELARQAAEDHRIRWRVRNLECASGQIAALAADWQAGRFASMTLVETRTMPSARIFHRSPRLYLLALRLTAPQRLAALVPESPQLRAEAADATAADLAYARGDVAVARAGYVALLGRAPESDNHWAGLALTLDLLDEREASRALFERPEVVAAVYRAVRTGTAAQPDVPDPVAIARWLAVTGSEARSQ